MVGSTPWKDGYPALPSWLHFSGYDALAINVTSASASRSTRLKFGIRTVGSLVDRMAVGTLPRFLRTLLHCSREIVQDLF